MTRLTNYEVYAFVRDRWTLHARYPGEERDMAILDAKRTENELNVPTKVIRESYYPHLNYSDEVTAYISPLAKRQTKASGKGKGVEAAAQRQGAAAAGTAQGKRSKRQPPDIKSSTEFFARFIGALCGAFLAATLITLMIRLILQTLPNFGFVLTLGSTQDILTLSFLVSFGFASMSLVRAFAPISYLFRKTPELFQPPPKASVTKREVNFEQPAPQDTKGDHARMRQLRGDLGTESTAPQPQDVQPSPISADETAAAQAPPAEETAGQSATAHEPESVPAPAPDPQEEPHPLLEGPGKKLTDLVIGRFVESCQPVLQASDQQDDRDVIWSTTWFVNGAADRFAREIGATSREIRPLAADALGALGITPLEEAETGAQKPATHGYRIGQDAMEAFLNRNIAPTGFLEKVIAGDVAEPEVQVPGSDEVVILTNVFPRSAPEGQFSHDVPGFIREKHANTVKSNAEANKGQDPRPVKAGMQCRFPTVKDAIAAVTDVMDDSMDLRQHGFAIRFCGGLLSSAPDHDVGLLSKRLQDEILAGTPDSFIWSGTLSEAVIDQAKSFSLRQKGLADGEPGESKTFVPVLSAPS